MSRSQFSFADSANTAHTLVMMWISGGNVPFLWVSSIRTPQCFSAIEGRVRLMLSLKDKWSKYTLTAFIFH